MSVAVLDASAVLACLNNEPGGDAVAELVLSARCVMSAVNHAEVMTRLCDWGLSLDEAGQAIGSLDLDVVAFDAQSSRECAALRSSTRGKGLSLGDRACLALARRHGGTAYTADRAWLEFASPLDLRIICIRS